MDKKQERKHKLIANYILKRFKEKRIKIGIIINGIEDINPEDIIQRILTNLNSDLHLYVSVVGYADIHKASTKTYSLSPDIESAVSWRNNRNCAGKIIVFTKNNDIGKLHSLSELDEISIREISQFLIEQEIGKPSNKPTNIFWKVLKKTSDYYTFDDLDEFIDHMNLDGESIHKNMWRLYLLDDCDLLAMETEEKQEGRLIKNRNLISDIGRLSKTSRKNLSESLAKKSGIEKENLQRTYIAIQNFYKYGRKDALRNLTYAEVDELLRSSSRKSTKKITSKRDSSTIRTKEVVSEISNAIVRGGGNSCDSEEFEDIKKLLSDQVNNSTNPDYNPTLGSREIIIDSSRKEINKLVGKFCNENSWGGIIWTDESTLKDAVSSIVSSGTNKVELFNPCKNTRSRISNSPELPADHDEPLFSLIKKFDGIIKFKSDEKFTPTIVELIESRKKLNRYVDIMINYTPLYLFFDEGMRDSLISYVKNWERLYRSLALNETEMKDCSNDSTHLISNAILLLDVLYIRTPTEWKGMLLPLNPIFLWPYYKIFQMLIDKGESKLEDSDAEALSKTLSNLPHLPNFLIVNCRDTNSDVKIVLPSSGNLGDVLPTFENKTNRYLGNDGVNSIKDVLTRWLGYAPYTITEIRICTVDAPDLTSVIQQIKEFIDENSCDKVIYDVYLTRGQNGNSELSKIDYSDKDFYIGKYIREERISITINNVGSSRDVKDKLMKRPVHVAFYFDQSSYEIGYGPSNQSLYINPLVVTYDYNFDKIQSKGSIFPSSETNLGLINDYNKLLKSVDLISSISIPRITCCTCNQNKSTSSAIDSVVSTINEGTQWLVVADRDTNNYQPDCAILIGEKRYDGRMVNVWTSDKSRIIDRYLATLKNYNLRITKNTRNELIYLLKNFGHISSNGLIGIPKSGANGQDVKNKTKGLLGTLFASSWYLKKYHNDSLVASLDGEKAKLWLKNNDYGGERADLVGLTYDDNEQDGTLYVRVIEVKTRDNKTDYKIEQNEGEVENDEENNDDYKIDQGKITGHAADQIAGVIKILSDIFDTSYDDPVDILTSARREVFKYQIISECFRNIHNPSWQEKWFTIFKKVFKKERTCEVKVEGLILDIRLNKTSGGKNINCEYDIPTTDPIAISVNVLTSTEIQQDVFNNSVKNDDLNETKRSLENSESSQICKSTESMSITDCTKNTRIAAVNETNSSMVEEGHKERTNKRFELTAINEEVAQLVNGFKMSCGDYGISLGECDPKNSIIGPSVIRLRFKLARGQKKQLLSERLEDIGRGMKRTQLIIQQVNNSDELLLDIPRLSREKVLFKEIVDSLPKVTSPEQLYFPLGKTPDGKDLIEDLGEMPHMLVGGSTGSGKSVLLFTMLAAFLKTHPSKDDLQLVLSSSKIEDFRSFQGLPHLSFSNGAIISDAKEATEVITHVIQNESERRCKLLVDARVSNIIEYNKKNLAKIPPIVVVIDEFADLADQLEKKSQEAFYTPIRRIAQTGRSRGIHLVVCTQRPEHKLVPTAIKAQLNARIALRVTDGINSKMIIDTPDAKNLQGYGDMIYKNSNRTERAQGYFISTDELDAIVENIKSGNLG